MFLPSKPGTSSSEVPDHVHYKSNTKAQQNGGGGGGEKWGFREKILEIQNIYSQSFKSPAREGKEKRDKTKKEPRSRNSSHILEIILNITQPPKKHMPKTCTHQISLSPTKSFSPNYFGRQCASKATWTKFQISQVLCKSTKSMRIGARILVADSFS